jgi:hypothetical protein
MPIEASIASQTQSARILRRCMNREPGRKNLDKKLATDTLNTSFVTNRKQFARDATPRSDPDSDSPLERFLFREVFLFREAGTSHAIVIFAGG